MVYCVEGCGEIQKHERKNFVIIDHSKNIVEHAKNSFRVVPGSVGSLVDAA